MSKLRGVEDYLKAGTVVDNVKEDQVRAQPARIRDPASAHNFACEEGMSRWLLVAYLCLGHFGGTDVVFGADIVWILWRRSFLSKGHCIEAQLSARQ